MMTVKKVSQISGVSVRTLHHYDRIGLLRPSRITEAGYRLYDDEALARLRDILMFKELEFALEDIRVILDSPGFDRTKALNQQIEMLKLKKEHLDELINLARGIISEGDKKVSFKAFDREKLDDYARRAKETWGNTEAYKEYEEKEKIRTPEESGAIGMDMMDIFREFGEIKEKAPDCSEAVALVKKLRNYITANFYTCTDDILLSLGTMYAAGGEFTENIDKAGGEGTAAFAANAIESLLGK